MVPLISTQGPYIWQSQPQGWMCLLFSMHMGTLMRGTWQAGGPSTFNQNYDCSKLLLTSFTGELAQRLPGTGNCLWHPLLHSQHHLPTFRISFQHVLAIKYSQCAPKPGFYSTPTIICVPSISLNPVFTSFQPVPILSSPTVFLSCWCFQYQHHPSCSSCSSPNTSNTYSSLLAWIPLR